MANYLKAGILLANIKYGQKKAKIREQNASIFY